MKKHQPQEPPAPASKPAPARPPHESLLNASVLIENLHPLLDGGIYPIKRVENEDLAVSADIFKDGHDILRALLKWRKLGSSKWNETDMRPDANDRWEGVLPLVGIGVWEYTIEAWGDRFASWQSEFQKKYDSGLRDLSSEILEGAALVKTASRRASASNASDDAATLNRLSDQLSNAKDSPDTVRSLIETPEINSLMAVHPDRSLSTEFSPPPRVRVERKAAAFSAWYEFFPRSAEGRPDGGSTFRDCLPRIDDAKSMGFDVIYFPPIHPIGETKRKGSNNSLTCQSGDPGVPYAIGNFRQGVNGGGHLDVAPELGTIEDFEWLVAQIHKRGMEVALDFAINCSPDHPFVRDHPDWFHQRPDGSIKYAENPPKKYEDIFPLNFYNPDWRALWCALRDIFLFWCGKGVRIFRVDNPHTKPIAFWKWVIAEVQAEFEDAIFLSEAFTRPKMMCALAKAGFTQSYTYFTWRNTKHELTEYFTELTQTDMVEYFRPHLFTNTPDILPFFLQHGGRPAFVIRAILAATLSPLYGIYSGFELCENAAIPDKEEYLDSEKYQFKGRDWNAPGNIKELLARLNAIRAANRALHSLPNLRFHAVDNDQILFYSKMTPSKDNILLAVVSLDPWNQQSGFLDVPVDLFGFQETDAYQVEDLLTGERFMWSGRRNYAALHPHRRPAHIFRVRRWAGREQDFDYFQ